MRPASAAGGGAQQACRLARAHSRDARDPRVAACCCAGAPHPAPCASAHLVKEAKGLWLWLQQAHHGGHLHHVREVAQALHDLHREVDGHGGTSHMLLQVQR